MGLRKVAHFFLFNPWNYHYLLLFWMHLVLFLPFLMQYKNVRPDYLKNIWKVIDWKYASEVYAKECP